MHGRVMVKECHGKNFLLYLGKKSCAALSFGKRLMYFENGLKTMDGEDPIHGNLPIQHSPLITIAVTS
jgi:hypothetical protein